MLNDLFWLTAKPLFWVIMGVGFWGILAFDEPFNASFIWVWRHLVIPGLALSWLYGWTQRFYFMQERRVSPGRFWFYVLAIPPIMLLMSAGGVALINGSFSTGETVVHEGPIKEMFQTGGRSPSWQVRLTDEKSGAEVTLRVSSGEYRTLKIGDAYRRRYRIGILGIPFRSRKEDG